MRLTNPNFRVTIDPNLPRLSWIMKLGSTSTVFCGEGVEVFDNGIIEGCWDDNFPTYAFNKTANLFGSGFIVDSGNLIFCPPSHTNDGLFVLFHKLQTYISNSLPFLFSFSGLPVDYNHNYTKRLITLLDGINDYSKLIYRSDTTTLYRVLFDNFFIRGEDIHYLRKPNSRQLSDFPSYHSYLLETLESCIGNANHSNRKLQYTPVTTCSSGYDSNTCAALAAHLGYKQAITLKTSRNGKDDSGAKVAAALGMQCVEHERPNRPEKFKFSELEFLNNGMGGGDFVFSVFEESLEHKICLTGYHGDKIWDPSMPPNSELIRGDNSGCSLSEFRLRVGFIHIPVPFIAARRHQQIYEIGNSTGMNPYRMGGRYDRPICRRIVEEMGVERSLFGHRKKAVTIGFIWNPTFLSKESHNDFDNYLKKNKRYLNTYFSLQLFHVGNYLFEYVNGILTREIPVSTPARFILNLLNKLLCRFKDYEGTTYCKFLFNWALEKSKANFEIPRN